LTNELLDGIYWIRCEVGLKLLDDASIDLVVTSPPYDEMREYKGFDLRIEEVISELYRVIKPGGVIIWVVGDETKEGNETTTAFEHIIRFKDTGLILYDTMIFRKQNAPPKSHRRYEPCFEYMFVLSKGKPSTTRLIVESCRRAGKNRVGNTYIHDSSDNLVLQHKEGKVLNEKIRSNIWEYTVGNAEKYRNIVKRQHPAKFPLLLARDHILSWSNEGEIVLDPFMGSGTTAIAAKLTNRRYIGFEISREYCNKCAEYMKQLNYKLTTKDKKVIEFRNEIKEIKYKK
jgi:site-specific DNA-methyltransferase (adenine-specific)